VFGHDVMDMDQGAPMTDARDLLQAAIKAAGGQVSAIQTRNVDVT
jgi:hypothetical protein